MRKEVLLSGIFALLLSCGGTGTEGVTQDGFFTLSITGSGSISSYAVSLQSGTMVFPDDAIAGEATLTTDLPETERPRAFVKSVSFCIQGKCFYGSAGQEVTYGTPFAFEVVVPGIAIKTDVPYIVLNPYEDEIASTSVLSATVEAGANFLTETHLFTPTSPNLQLTATPVNPATVRIETDPATFVGSYTVDNYTLGTNAVYTLPKGSAPSNSIVPGTLRISTGTTVCIDDGSGNIVNLDRTRTDCSGGIDYTSGYLQLTIAGTGPAQLDISYQVSGKLYCYDNGAGVLLGDCTSGLVNYSTGQVLGIQLVLGLADPSVGMTVSYASGSTSTNQVVYVLPPNMRVGNRDVVYGRQVDVLINGSWLCSLDNPTAACQVAKSGNTLTVNFGVQVSGQVELRYTEDTVYNANPAVDARAFGHLWNGLPYATLEGILSVEVYLETGETVSASRTVQVTVLPELVGGL